ncbi:MAG: hypothetical protein C0606_15300 [Hyphomicrobiales bacterium]|nr:MAG: hypothetical protein C0606_15300 [Hyphomicrobiales bacterium]
MITLEEFDHAAEVVYSAMLPTPQYAWPLLAAELGVDVWVKHENATPTGAFKVRGGLVFVDRLMRENSSVKGIASATRGNHGQSLAYAARRAGIGCAIVVPYGNSQEKNAAMRAFGADLIEHGADFDAAKEKVAEIAAERGYEMVPSFHRDLVKGVGTYSREFLSSVSDLDTVFVPIGLGSGICGMISARNALGLKTKIVGVVSEGAPAYALSFEAGKVVDSDKAITFADGVAVRGPAQEAFDVIKGGAERIVRVSDAAIAEAVRLYFRATHCVAEGAGAAGLAAVMAERESLRGKKVGVVLSGQNIDAPWYREILAGGVPTPA